MNTTRRMIVLAVLIIALGTAWLLNSLQIIPGVDWLWAAGLGVSGILILAITGINRFTFVIGSFLLVSSVCSVLRQTGKIPAKIELPVLFIVFGVLILVSLLLPLPTPDIFKEDQRDGRQ